MAAISARSRVGWASRVLARRFAFSDTSFQGSVSFGIAGGNGCTGHAGALLSQLGAHHATRTAPGVSAKPTMSSTGRCGPLDLTKPLGVQRPWANLYRVHTVSFLGRRSLEFRRPFVVPQRAGGEFSGSGGGWDRDGGDRRQQYRFRQYQGWEGDGPKPPLWTLLRNPLLFSGAFTLGSFAVAAIYRDESRRSAPVFENPFTRTPRRRKTHEILGMQFTTAEVVVWSIIGANCAVSLAWLRSMRGQYSHLHAHPWLQRYFLHHPFSGRGAPLLFSAFSHNTGPHLVFNMLALYSFAPGIIQALGPENFLASYMSACVLSSLGGMAIKLATTSTIPSLGASGGVLFLASCVALLYPNAQFALIFLPFISLPAPTLLLGIVAVDVTGLLLRWRTFDHGAHLAAVACGVTFVNGGAHLIAQWQVEVVRRWRQLRRSLAGRR